VIHFKNQHQTRSRPWASPPSSSPGVRLAGRAPGPRQGRQFAPREINGGAGQGRPAVQQTSYKRGLARGGKENADLHSPAPSRKGFGFPKHVFWDIRRSVHRGRGRGKKTLLPPFGGTNQRSPRSSLIQFRIFPRVSSRWRRLMEEEQGKPERRILERRIGRSERGPGMCGFSKLDSWANRDIVARKLPRAGPPEDGNPPRSKPGGANFRQPPPALVEKGPAHPRNEVSWERGHSLLRFLYFPGFRGDGPLCRSNQGKVFKVRKVVGQRKTRRNPGDFGRVLMPGAYRAYISSRTGPGKAVDVCTTEASASVKRPNAQRYPRRREISMGGDASPTGGFESAGRGRPGSH